MKLIDLFENSSQLANTWTEAEQIAYVKKYWSNIRNITNPILEVQLAAVQQDGWAIQYITNPSIPVQLAAVQQNGRAIQYITNPTIPVQLAAVQENGLAIQFITNPTIPIQLAAVQENGCAIQFITNPTPLIQTAACFQHPDAINRINPIESTNISLMKKYRDQLEPDRLTYLEQIENGILTESINSTDPNDWSEDDRVDFFMSGIFPNGQKISDIPAVTFTSIFRKITNPSEAVKKAYVHQNVWNFIDLKDTSEEIQLYAVKRNSRIIQYIDDPSASVQLAAVQKNPHVIELIKRPFPLVQWAACNVYPGLVRRIPAEYLDPSLRKHYADLLADS